MNSLVVLLLPLLYSQEPAPFTWKITDTAKPPIVKKDCSHICCCGVGACYCRSSEKEGCACIGCNCLPQDPYLAAYKTAEKQKKVLVVGVGTVAPNDQKWVVVNVPNGWRRFNQRIIVVQPGRVDAVWLPHNATIVDIRKFIYPN